MTSVSEADVIERAVGTHWDPVLAGVRADALDCLQSTLAIIADDAYGPGAHLALGSRWRFPVRGPDGVIGVQPSVAERMAQASEVLGLQVSQPEGPLDPLDLRRLASTAPVYVVGESYDLQWLPYARAATRYQNMPHSFLLEKAPSGYLVVDAYRTDTEWGRARPTAWALSAAGLDRAIGSPALALRVTAGPALPTADRAAAMTANAVRAQAAAPDIDAYADGVRAALEQPEGIERLVLDIWVLCRERLLHTAWLGGHPAAGAVGAAVQKWQELAGHSYLAMRRARRGALPAVTLAEDVARLLHSDAALMVRLAGASAPAQRGGKLT